MSQYNRECLERALESIKQLKAKGVEPTGLEISEEIWTLIQMGGFNMFPGKKIFAGLHVRVITESDNRLEAVGYPFEEWM